MNVGNGRMILGNCLDVMADIPDASIDMVLCDLPYGTTACSWDTIIPFEPLWAHYWRVAKPNAAIVLTASQPFTSALVMSQIGRFRYQWVWVKNSPGGFAQAKNKPMPKHEDVLVFSKGRTGHVSQCKNRVPYFPQGLRVLGKEIRNSQGHRASAFESRANARASYVQEFTGYPDSVLSIDVQRDAGHPTQKPVALFEYLIRTYTNEGGTVLDNCSGSGTTAIAAINSGRRFVCIEQDVEYYYTSLNRVREALTNP